MMAKAALVALLMVGVSGCVTTTVDDRDGETGPAVAGYGLDCSIAHWLEACVAWASPNPSPTKAEIDLVVNPLDWRNVFVASKDLDPVASDCVWSVGQVTTDGGHTWTTVYVGGTKEDRADPAHPLHQWDCVTDPIMAWDADGVLYYALQAYNLASDGPSPPEPLFADGSAFFLAVSHDGGRTFAPEDIIPLAAADGSLIYHDYPRMTVNPATGTVLTVWNAINVVPGGFIQPWVVATRDGGRTADPPAIVTFPDAPHTTRFFSGFAATNDGTIYLTVSKTSLEPLGSSTRDTAWLAVSTDDGRTFPETRHMFDVVRVSSPERASFRTGTGVELAADNSGGPRDGRLWSAWADNRSGSFDILSAWSDDEGVTWSDPVTVAGHPHDEFMSRLTVDGRGNPHVIFFDRSHDPADTLLDVSHATSVDGGLTWQRTRLTNQSFDGDLGLHQDGGSFIGDYLGIGSTGDDVWMGFPTTRTGVAEIGVAHAAWTAPADA